jgi:hypothetical protein
LPSSEAALQAKPTYELAGASWVQYRGIPAAMVVYEAPSGTISLLVESGKAAVVARGDESHYGALLFHYRNEGRFKVITWSAHNLSYALVSSIAHRNPAWFVIKAWQITGSSAGSRSAAFTKNLEHRNKKRLDVSYLRTAEFV